MSLLKRFFVEEQGQDMVEYGLVIALVVIAGATAYGTFATPIDAAITALGASVAGLF